MTDITAGMGLTAAQPPEAPSGFNYTQHNCNSTRRKRPKGQHCGKYTMIGFVSERYTHHKFRCKSYSCGRCGPKKIRLVRKRIVRLATENRLQRFLTLTLDPKKLEPEWDVKLKILYLYAIWRKMRVYLRRKLGRSLTYIAVVELQRNGNPHLHLLVGSYLPKNWISAAWQALGGGWSTRIEYADVHRVAAYLAKYVTDDSLAELPAGTRRFSASRGLALFDRSKGEGAWVIVRGPIECWRFRAGGVTVEQYETEEDGARSLASFVAVQVDCAIAERLHDPHGAKLWLELKPPRRRKPSC